MEELTLYVCAEVNSITEELTVYDAVRDIIKYDIYDNIGPTTGTVVIITSEAIFSGSLLFLFFVFLFFFAATEIPDSFDFYDFGSRGESATRPHTPHNENLFTLHPRLGALARIALPNKNHVRTGVGRTLPETMTIVIIIITTTTTTTLANVFGQ